MSEGKGYAPPGGKYAVYVPHNRRMVTDVCPQTHPERFTVKDLKREIAMLKRMDSRFGAHALRAVARVKLMEHIAARRKAHGMNTP